MTPEMIDTFLSHLDRTGGKNSCHVWRGARSEPQGGYGIFCGEGAHRFAWRLKNGEIPDGAVIRHNCDNPPCCNPAHLMIGDHADNRSDCVTRKRQARGQVHGKSKLTHRQVRFIRTHHKGWTHQEIAEKYGVSRATITKILLGQTYAGVGVRCGELKRTSQIADDAKK